MIHITEQVSIPEEELSFRTSRSSGPGGQNVNKVETRVALLFDLFHSQALSEDQKIRVQNRLKSRINKEGVLQVVSQRARSQAGNRTLALDRFVLLLQKALKQAPVRKKTSISKGARERRLEEKKRHGKIKQARSGPFFVEE
jgi:ribosome-associated protein